jgi:hypothetical protein
VIAGIAVGAVALSGRRRRLREVDWARRSSATVAEVDSLAVHLGSAEASALSALAARDAPRLADLIAALRQLQAESPAPTMQEDLGRLISVSGELQTLLMSTQLPGPRPDDAEVQRSAASVTSAAATVEAGIRRMQTEGTATSGGSSSTSQ